MNFSLSNEQKELIDAISKTVHEFDDNYWLETDQKSKFPHKFVKKIADGGWLGIAMPLKYGGSNLGVTEASLMMMTVSDLPLLISKPMLMEHMMFLLQIWMGMEI